MTETLRLWARNERALFVICCLMIPFSLLRLVAAIHFGSAWGDRLIVLLLWIQVAIQSVRAALLSEMASGWRAVANHLHEAGKR